MHPVLPPCTAAALLHDIGKVGISDAILFKTGPLTGLEEEVLRNHTLTGGDVLKAMAAEARAGSFLGLAKNIAYFHHERWDGSGYPYGLRGEAGSRWKRASCTWPTPTRN